MPLAADREEGEMETGYSSEEPEVSTTGFLPKTTMELLETLWGNDERWKVRGVYHCRRKFLHQHKHMSTNIRGLFTILADSCVTATRPAVPELGNACLKKGVGLCSRHNVKHDIRRQQMLKRTSEPCYR